MKRKVIQLAGKTMVVSLPSQWVKKYGIQKGQDIDVEEKGPLITINSSKGTILQRISKDIGGLDRRLIRWYVTSVFKAGFDEVELLYSHLREIEVVQDCIRSSLMGFEIVEQSGKRCLIRNVSLASESEFDLVLRRMFVVAVEMAASSLESIRKGSYDELEGVLFLEETNNKLVNFCQRILCKRGYPDNTKTMPFYILTWEFEKIVDEYRSICILLCKNRESKPCKKTLEIYQGVNALLADTYNLFYSYEDKKAARISSQMEVLEETLKKELGGADTALLVHLFITLDMIKNSIATIVGTKI